MKRVKLLQVTLSIPVPADDDWQLEIEDEIFDILQLAHATMVKAGAEIEQAVIDAMIGDHPCTLIEIEGDYEEMSLEEFRAKPQRTRQQH